MIDLRPPLAPPLSPPPPQPGAPESPERPSSAPRLSGPGWLAATGATLLLVAAVVVVAGQWSAIGPTARFAGLVGALFAVYFSAEACRARIPTTATSLAVLAACVTAPVGVAAVAALEGRWPLCILIGGGAALIATELQSRRWKVRTLKAATVAAAVLLIGGASVLAEVPAAVLCASASAIAFAAGARRRSFVLAITVPVVPALWLLAEVGVGPGVFARMGVVGAADWVIPVSTLIAGITLAVSAHASNRPDVAATALVVLAYSCVSALIEALPALSIWLSAPSAVALSIAIATLGRDRSILSRWAAHAAPVAATVLAIASWIAPIAIVVLRVLVGGPARSLAAQLLLPAAMTLTALVALAATIGRSAALDDIVRFGCVAASVAVVAAADIDLVWVAVAALAGWLLTSAITNWRSWVATSSLHAVWAVVAVSASNSTPILSSAIIVGAVALVIVACFSWHNFSAAVIVVPLVIGGGALLLAMQWPSDLAIVAATIAVLAAAVTGVAMFRTGFTATDSLALALGGCAGLVAFSSSPAGASLGLSLLAAQIWIYGAAFRRTAPVAVAAPACLIGLMSLWWTTGTNDLVIDWISPYGADGQDLALGASSLALVGAGLALRTVQRASSWLAYSPGLSLAFAWLFIAQQEPDADWATLGALVVGVVAVGVGGVWRLAAPLVIGTVGMIATGVTSMGDRLASAPTWTWIAVGGIGLLVVAALLERSQRPLLPTRQAGNADAETHHRDESSDGEVTESLVEAFARTFA